MAGVKGRSGGHNRKTVKQLRESGGYKPHRHGDIVDLEWAPGAPVVPRGLKACERKLWDRVVKSFPAELLHELDTEALEKYVRLHGLETRLFKLLSADPLDPVLKNQWQSVYDRYEKASREWGATPNARTATRPPRKKAESEEKQVDPFSSLRDRLGDQFN